MIGFTIFFIIEFIITFYMEKAHNFLKIILDSILHGLRVCLRAIFKNNFILFRIKNKKTHFIIKNVFYIMFLKIKNKAF